MTTLPEDALNELDTMKCEEAGCPNMAKMCFVDKRDHQAHFWCYGHGVPNIEAAIKQ